MPKRKPNVLITCAGGSASLFYAKRLARSYKIFFVDATDHTIARFKGLPFQKIPFGNSPSFARAIDKLVKKWKIDVILPGADEELLPVSKYCAAHRKVAAIIPTAPFIALCLNKNKLMLAMDRAGISQLLPFRKISEVRYPAIVKPVYGRGSKEVHKIAGRRELEGYLRLYGKKFSDVLVQPFVDGEEYTVSVIVNDKNKLIGIVPKLVILKRGITRIAVTKHEKRIESLCREIVEEFKPCGPFNVQLKYLRGVPYVFEINPRLSTTSVLTDEAFGNELDLFMRYRGQDRILKPPKMKSGVYLYRYEENIFIKP
ncbi:MAG: ATP-grasp domain-containing protein [Patescibacteria group bacterium]